MTQSKQTGSGFTKLLHILTRPFFDKNVVVAVRLSNEPRKRKNAVPLNPIYNITNHETDEAAHNAIGRMAFNLAMFEKTLKDANMDRTLICQLVIQYHQAMLQAFAHEKFVP